MLLLDTLAGGPHDSTKLFIRIREIDRSNIYTAANEA